jgi:hypothetical protein
LRKALLVKNWVIDIALKLAINVNEAVSEIPNHFFNIRNFVFLVHLAITFLLTAVTTLGGL